ncbi:MAG TPA: hypothetical protein ENN80_04855, partial [Candidatus Hydrogenedentes bacterium]|nr:hypothetical protein [Candidatus Hydrogenedentota bacterium]
MTVMRGACVRQRPDQRASIHAAPRAWDARLAREARMRRPFGAARLMLLRSALQFVLRATGLWERGVRNANSPMLRHEVFALPRVPAAFDGFRVLLLSDLHFDGRTGYLDAFRSLVEQAEADLCVLTGDYPWRAKSDSAWVKRGLDVLTHAIEPSHGFVGILGNNDLSLHAELLGEHGIEVLVNAAIPVHMDGESIWLVGVDDAHDFRCDDLGEALSATPAQAFRILLAHSPELIGEAARHEVDLY